MQDPEYRGLDDDSSGDEDSDIDDKDLPGLKKRLSEDSSNDDDDRNTERRSTGVRQQERHKNSRGTVGSCITHKKNGTQLASKEEERQTHHK